MQITLTGIRYSAHASHETACYEAMVRVDGQPCALVSNDGHGGSDRQSQIKGAPWTVAAIDEWCQTNLPHWEICEGETAPTDLELWCAEQVEAWLVERDLRRALRSRVLYLDAKSQLRECRWKGVRTIEPRHVEAFQKRRPGLTVLNVLPFAEALALYRQQGAE